MNAIAPQLGLTQAMANASARGIATTPTTQVPTGVGGSLDHSRKPLDKGGFNSPRWVLGGIRVVTDDH